MKQKKRIYRAIVVLVICVAALFFIKRERENREWEATNPSNPSNRITTVKSDTITEKFSYEVKESYTSRDEVLQEIENMLDSADRYRDGKDDSVRSDASDAVKELYRVLYEKLSQFPKSEAETLYEKEYKLDQEVYFAGLFLSDASFNLKAQPDNAEYQQKNQECKERYDFVENTQKRYVAGEITIDEALNLCGVEYDANKSQANLWERIPPPKADEG